MNEERMAHEFAQTTDWANGREKEIVSWLENFQPNHRELALHLLRGVRFFNLADIRHWCQVLHGYLPAEVRKPGNDTRYLGLGMPAESGSLVAYYYRGANEIPLGQFLEPKQIVDKTYLLRQHIKTIVLLDDFIGSGNQAIEFWQDLSASLGAAADSFKFFYSAFIGYREGQQLIESQTKLTVNLVRQLDDQDKAFGFGSPLIVEYAREAAKDVFRQYGQRLFPKHPLGYRDGQALIVFDHNTPNNSLPVLWSEEDGWFPLFKRYIKFRLPNRDSIPTTSSMSTVAARPKAVLFADIVNTSASSPNESREMTELASELLRSAHGKLFGPYGDSLLVAFSSCTDSLRYAFELQNRLRVGNLAQKTEITGIQVRIGIDFGEVTDSVDAMYGSTINRALRICQKCPPGEIYFSEDVFNELHKSEFTTEVVRAMKLKGVDQEVTLYRLVTSTIMRPTPNPFVFGQPVFGPQAFFGRIREMSLIRAFLHGRQNCQLVGPRRIGKTSFLFQVQRNIVDWEEKVSAAYIDLQNPVCYTLAGLLATIGREFGHPRPVRTLGDLAEFIDERRSRNIQLVLCLDEFERVRLQPGEFTLDFFHSLRSFSHNGMSMITVSLKPLSELVQISDPSSPFFNTFALLRLGLFTQAEAEEFVDSHRPGLPPFTQEEKDTILSIARRHPMALQTACFFVVAARNSQRPLSTAIQEASEQIDSFSRYW